MINGAIQILTDVPSRYLDALLLVKSQSREATGFVMIAYDQDTTSNCENTCLPVQWFYDILFFRGQNIFDCVRLNQDLRFRLSIDTALRTFHERREHSKTSVFLFEASEDLLQRFRSTFYYEPCLKVQIESLTQEQISALLRASRCQFGILECNEFIEKQPAIQLIEIRSQNELEIFRPASQRGRLLLYDVEKNKEVLRERCLLSAEGAHHAVTISGERDKRIHALTGSWAKPFSVGKPVAQPDKTELDEFTRFIHQILNSPMSGQESDSTVEKESQTEKSVEPCSGFEIRVKEDICPDAEPENCPGTPAQTGSGNTPPAGEIRAKKNFRDTEKRTGRRVKSTPQTTSPPDETKHPAGETQNPESAYVLTFERLFRTFRRQIFACFGNKCEEMIGLAERKVEFLSPDFDVHALTDATAHSVLDLIGEIVDQAGFMKRSKLRQAAISLISDLYNKQYNLLEQHRVIDKVEEMYYHLKK